MEKLTKSPKSIKLLHGSIALVDEEDFEYLNKWTWYLDKDGYAITGDRSSGKLKTVRMHRLAMKAIAGQQVDHIDLNKLNNQKSNLRFCTQSQNNANKGKLTVRNTTSKYKGVVFMNSCYRSKPWKAQYKSKCLGYARTEEEAAAIYNKVLLADMKEFARVNLLQYG